ncbi:MAG: DUF192 domain-containing protein [Elusimicrobia bacterium]|nr:DUF192 domain-containing protein [Elusimicrobiota bacterium]
MIARNQTKGSTVATKVERADTLISRAVGLLGRGSMEQGAGLWLDPCVSVHMFFMRFPIDVVFLDREGKVVRVFEDLKPWRMTPYVNGARSALELAGGSLRGSVETGDILEIS